MSVYSVFIRPEAEVELKDTFDWYEQQREGLSADLVLCIDESIAKISRSPEQYPFVYKNIRRALIRRFPFGIFYLVERDLIIVLAFFHARRNPADWKSRG
ncbi:MAG TPA: type II toxin-antitoxin system RelE/ParE family toxin [Cellvibrio sp.]|nr:type II toxin-antitoxin system RelE/ParE family toxin [Cellvibrio sp.]